MMNQKIKNIRQILLAFLLLIAVTSCEKNTFTPPAVDPNTPQLFQTDIQPIFNAKCVTCHGGVTSPNLSDGRAYQSLTRGNYLNTTDPASSRLYTKMNSADHVARSTETDRLKVLYWITQGALNN